MTLPGAADAVHEAILAALPLGIWVFGPDLRLAYANPATGHFLRLAAGPLPAGTPLAEAVRRLTDGDREAPAAEPRRIEGGQPFRHRIRGTGGTRFELVGTPLPAGGHVLAAQDVIDLPDATAAAVDRVRLLETLTAHLHAGIAAYDPQRCVVFSNPAYEDLLGLPRGSIRPGMSFETLFLLLKARGEFANQDADAVIADRRAIDRSRPASQQRQRPNGEVVRVESQPLPDGGYLVEVTDITAARRAEDDAQRRAALLDGVLASLPHGVVVFGADDRVAMVNAAYQSMMSGTEVAIGEPREAIIRRRAAAGEYGPGEYGLGKYGPSEYGPGDPAAPAAQRMRPDGTVLEIRTAALPDGGTVQVTTDITALQVARAEATAQAATLQVMLDNMRHGLALFDSGRRLVAYNRLASALSGHGTESPIGWTLERLVQAQLRAGVFGAEEAERILMLDRAEAHRHQRDTADGRTIEIDSTPTPDGGFVVTWTDTTARARAEAAAEHRATVLQLAMDSMRHGFVLYDAEARLVTANRLGISYSSLTAEDMAPGRPLSAMLALQRDKGAFGPEPHAGDVVRDLLALDRRQEHHYRRSMPDGLILEVRSAPTADGGFVITQTDITALATAEAAARDRAGVLQAMLDNMRHGIAVFGPDQRVVVANDLCDSLAGLPPASIRPGRTLAELVEARVALNGAVDAATPAEEVAATLTRDRGRPHRQERRNADGRTVDVLCDPLPDGGFVLSYVDTSEINAARAEAQHRAGLLQTMQDSMRHGIALFGPDQRLIVANRLAAPLAGVPAAALVPGMSLQDLALRQWEHGVFGTGEAAEREVRRVVARDRSRSIPARRINPDGRVVDSVSDPTPDGGCVITWSDVTAQVQAEQAAEHRAATLQAMIDSMHHGVMLFDRDHRFVADNRLARELTGVPEDLARPGTSFAALSEGLVRAGTTGDPALDVEMAAAMATVDRSRPLHYTRPRQGGRMLEVFSDPMPDGGFVVTLSDITPLARAEAEAKARAATQAVMLDVIRHGISLFGPDRRLIAANRLAAALSGMPEDRLVPGTTHAEVLRTQQEAGIFGPEPGAQAMVDGLLAMDRSQPIRYQRRTPDGALIEVVSDPTPDGGFAITFSDITALAEAEAAAASRAATLQVALDNMRHGLLIYGPDRRLQAANALAVELSALQPEDMLPGAAFDALLRRQHASGRFGPEPEASAVLRTLLQADRTKRGRRLRPMSDGRLVEVFTDPTPDGGFVVSFTDITARARAEAEARSRAAMLRDALDSMRHALMLFGPDRRLLTANRLAGPDYALPDLTGREGVTLDALVEEQFRAGQLGDGDAAEAMRAEVLALDRGVPLRYRRTTRAGKVLEIGSDPTPDGGFVITHTDVTELARAQGEASARAAVLQLMLDNMRHGIAQFDRDKRLVTANRLAAEFNGIDPALMRPGTHAGELAVASLRAGMVTPEQIQALLRDDYSQPRRHTRVGTDGRVLDISTAPTPDGGFVATYTDITALTTAEGEARERAGILQVMLDNLRHGIQLFGPDRRLIAANRLAADLAGYPGDHLPLGAHLDDLIEAQLRANGVGGDVAGLRAAKQRIDRSRPARYVRPHRDGRMIEVTSDPTPDGGFVITMADVSALARAEAEAQHRAGVLQAMLDNIRHGIALFDADGRIQAVNPVFLALLDLPEEVMASGGSFAGFIDHLQARGEYGAGEAGQAVAERLKARDRSQPSLTTRTRPGGGVIEIASEPVPGGGFVLALTDVTEDRRIRAELERAKDAAEGANKAKSRFLATMSHELRTPLNAVIGFSEALGVDPDPVRGKEYVRSIHEAGRHLLSLIDDILDATRAETIGFQTVEGEVAVIPLVEGAVRVMQATAATAGVTLQATLPPALPALRADELRLRQVLLNLVANAVKFTPPGGSVSVTAEAESAGRAGAAGDRQRHRHPAGGHPAGLRALHPTRFHPCRGASPAPASAYICREPWPRRRGRR